MNTPPDQTPRPQPGMPGYVPTDANGIVHIDTRYPIPFDQHSFGTAYYDTYDCKVLYNNMYVADQSIGGPVGEKSVSSASLGDLYPNKVLDGAPYGGIRNFPPPAKVTWRSKDGQPHEAMVDIGAIFKDQIVLHKVPQDQLPPILTAPIFPDIILEVNDRTINVYMRAHVSTRVLQELGNPLSDYRSDLILAYSKTYD
ncbi:hypothetical protein [Pseudoxanthomonas dokdonensis]|uniref:Uncharacterized protein n=1 Tax=Pseudoxanthomonas dokdonensis TaxID=344882 RepID=A0A0R0CP49_9GAMM|nr:hypothetical protein [Pseudoxanthomonas dokdonensis]KRG71756.1 hypothetical protein ABB29_02845 [Pseudoxanthomonas dokdonensis]